MKRFPAVGCLLIATLCASAGAEPTAMIDRHWLQSARRTATLGESRITQLESDTVELETTSTPRVPWGAQLAIATNAPARKDDVLLIEAELRAAAVDPETGESALQLVLQASAEPYRVHDEAVAIASDRWVRHRIPVRVKVDSPAGMLQVAINFGVCRQRVELRRLSVVNLGAVESVRGLRSPPVTYAGREPDAPWRVAANKRIDELRKADLSVRVVDAAGRPVRGAHVAIQLKRHSFAFGTAVTARRINGASEDDKRYREVLQAHFNTAVFENDHKWSAWERGSEVEQQNHRRQVDAAVDWLIARGFEVRGHCLVWPELQRLPADVQELARRGAKSELRQRINGHVQTLTSHYAGRLREWDVVNEPTYHRTLQDVLGDDELVEWFRAAHRADPAARLFLNDFAMLSYGALNPQKAATMYEIARRLRDSGAPIHGIGEQAHFNDVLVSPARVLAAFDRFGELGLPIRITEFDIAADDPELQADYLRDFFTAAFSHPSVDGIVLWGFFEKNHWKPAAALWAGDWTRRPIGDAYVRLLEETWHTRAAGQTDQDGRFRVRGFLGEYDIVIEHNGQRHRLGPRLPAGGAEFTVPVP